MQASSVDRLRVGVFSHATDMHSQVIAQELRKFDDVACHLIAVDRLHERPSTVWSNAGKTDEHVLPTMSEGQSVDIADLDVIWWRRSPSKQASADTVDDSRCIELINNDCAAALIGLTDVAFRGVWISNPLNTRRAENKIVQLNVARTCGLRVPRTIVTQSPDAIGKFLKTIGRPVVVKALRGPGNMGIATSFFQPEYLAHTDSIQAAPAIYQEYVAGSCHLRVHCFGRIVLTASIESEDLDWRGNLTVPFRPFSLPKCIEGKLLLVLRELGLSMGIFDLKLTPGGDYFWLELNPQGQFLFIEALVKELHLTNMFSAFLRQQALAGRRMKTKNRHEPSNRQSSGYRKLRQSGSPNCR